MASAAVAVLAITTAAEASTLPPPSSLNYIFRHLSGVPSPGFAILLMFSVSLSHPLSLFINPLLQRERKQRKLYLEEWSLGDDDAEGARGFSVAEKLESSKFAQAGMVREMRGSDLTVA